MFMRMGFDEANSRQATSLQMVQVTYYTIPMISSVIWLPVRAIPKTCLQLLQLVVSQPFYW